MQFQKAERKQHKPKLAITGPSGSGKTFSAILMASGMGKKIAVIDTENKSASLYSDMSKGPLKGVSFDVLEIEPPYTIGKYTEAIALAQSAGYDVLVIDSISHAWAGEGGLLSKKEALDQRGGSNSYTNWAGITKEHEMFKSRILTADIILIATMRSKQDYVLEVNEKGKQAPKKVGMAPVQRDGMEYEFTTVFDMGMDHSAIASKDRTFMFDGLIFKPTKKTGEQIMEWLKGGKEVTAIVAANQAKADSERKEEAAAEEAATYPESETAAGVPEDDGTLPATEKQILDLKAGIDFLCKMNVTPSTIWAGIGKESQNVLNRLIVSTDGLSGIEADKILDYLNRWIDHKSKAKAGKVA